MYRTYVRIFLKHASLDAFKIPVRNYLPRRAQMYVPADSGKKIDKAITTDVDSIVLDCEDGVAVNRKSEARENIRSFLDKGKPAKKRNYDLAVRLNSTKPLLQEDISVILSGKHLPDTIVLPKVDDVEDLKEFADLINERIKGNNKVQLIMGLESAMGFLNLPSIVRHSVKLGEISRFRPVGVFFGSDDFCASIGATRSESSLEVLYARQKLVLTAKAYNLQVIDMVYIKYKDMEGLKKQAQEGAQLGFTGKQVIHPDQVPIVQEAFYPPKEKIEWASGLLEAFYKQQESGQGAFAYEGQMIDMPTMRQAQNIMDLVNSIMIRES